MSSADDSVSKAIASVVEGRDLDAADIESVFGVIMSGEATPSQIGGLLIGLRMKGPTPGEIAGAARAMRARASKVEVAHLDRSVDTCGTGGDGAGTVNVSTMGALVAAAAGAVVAKHGNRAISSRSGSADVLEALGVSVDGGKEAAERCIAEVGIGFLFAPAHHAATRHAAAPRRELGVRTLFNLLGPLTNPAGVPHQVIGVFAKEWCRPMAEALGQLGSKRVFVVHGAGGVDEIAVAGETHVAEWSLGEGRVVEHSWSPKDFGLKEADPDGLAGGDASHNAGVAKEVLAGAPGAPRCATILCAGAALVSCGLAEDLPTGAGKAAEAIDSGAAKELLAKLVLVSNSSAGAR